MGERREIEAILRPMHPGDAVEIAAPEGQPMRRIRYQRVNAVAYAVWGAGRYRLKSTTRGVLVTRRADNA